MSLLLLLFSCCLISLYCHLALWVLPNASHRVSFTITIFPSTSQSKLSPLETGKNYPQTSLYVFCILVEVFFQFLTTSIDLFHLTISQRTLTPAMKPGYCAHQSSFYWSVRCISFFLCPRRETKMSASWLFLLSQDEIMSFESDKQAVYLQVYRPVYFQLVDVLLHKAQFPSDQEYASWSSDEKEQFRIYRYTRLCFWLYICGSVSLCCTCCAVLCCALLTFRDC